MTDQGSAPEWNRPGIPAFPGTPGEVGVLELLEVLARLRAGAPVFVARELGSGWGGRLSGQASLALQGLEMRSALRPGNLALASTRVWPRRW
jgi:hypothetical protein